MDDSEGVYGTEADIREFFEREVTALGGELEKVGTNLFRADLPESLRQVQRRDVRPLHVQSSVRDGSRGYRVRLAGRSTGSTPRAGNPRWGAGNIGLKLLPFIEDPGITCNYRIRFTDGTGEVIREEMLPVFVDAGFHVHCIGV